VKQRQAKAPDKFRMNADEFERIMGKALKVKPEEAKAPRTAAKSKMADKKKRSPK